MRFWASLALVLSVLTMMQRPAAAAGEGVCPPGKSPVKIGINVICTVATSSGSPGTDGTAGTSGSSGSSKAPVGCFKTDGTEVPCQTDDGYWWAADQCYAKPYDAPAGTPAWQGHTDGSLWQCTTCRTAGSTSGCHVQIIWVAPGTDPTPPSPAQLAKTASDQIALPKAEIHTAPAAPAPTYVGVANWLWIPATQWAVLSTSVTAGATTVTATATPAEVVWQAGAQTVTCRGPGSVWRTGMTDAARTDCSVTFDQDSADQPGGSFALTARIRYEVTWTCSGTCSTTSGDLGLVDAPVGAGALRVLQRQTVVIQ